MTTKMEEYLDKYGRFPPVKLRHKPLDPNESSNVLENFISYSFDSSVVVPVDIFNFTFAAPDDPRPLPRVIKEGDIVQLDANDKIVCTGIIDQTEVHVSAQQGEQATIVGRDLMGQFEDQSAVNNKAAPIFGKKLTVAQTFANLQKNTRIPGLIMSDAPVGSYLFGTEPGESKLAALQRYLEPLNCLAWTNNDGKIIIGRPDMSSKTPSLGKLICSKKDRFSNVIDMRAIRASTSIPNIVCCVWTSQEQVQNLLPKNQILNNRASGPSRLAKFGHYVPRMVVVSNPSSGGPQGYRDVNDLVVAGGAGSLLQAYGKREIARFNVKEIMVECVVAGHYNDNGEPFRPNQMYDIFFDRGDVNEKMYLFHVVYNLTPDQGQTTTLRFCRLGALVSDVRAT